MAPNITKYDFKEGLPQEFELIEMKDFFETHHDKLIESHRTDFYHILWLEEGNLSVLTDFNPVKISSKSMLFIPKDCVLQFDKNDTLEGKIIIFTQHFFGKTKQDTKFLYSTPLFNSIFSISQISIFDTQISDLFQQIKREYDNLYDTLQPEILRNLLHGLLLLAERELKKQSIHTPKASADLDYVLAFKDLVEKNFVKIKKVNYYAQSIGISEKRLNKATSNIIGKNPKQMIDDRIILEIKRLLVHTNKSIKEIGYDLGYEEPTYFIKFFRKHNQSTPSEFRNQFALT